MTGGHHIPPPPLGPISAGPANVPPPLPTALPMHAGGPPHGAIHQHQGPNGSHMQAPLGNVPHLGGPGLHNAPHLQGATQFAQGQGNLQQRPPWRTLYRYYQARKPTARDLETGVKPSWALATFSEVSIPSAEIEEKVRVIRAQANRSNKRSASERSAIDEYNELPAASMRDKVDELLHKHRLEEYDPTMEWSIAAIETEKRAINRLATETTAMRVYIKRSLRAEFLNHNMPGVVQPMGTGLIGPGGAFNGQRPIQNAQVGQNPGGNFPGGNFPGVPGPAVGGQGQMPGPLPGPLPGAPNPFPGGRGPQGGPSFPLNITPIKVGKKDKKDEKKGKGKDKDKDKRKGKKKGTKKSKRNDYDSDSDSDGYSDSSTDSSVLTDGSDEEIKDEIEDLVRKLTRRNSLSTAKAHRGSYPSKLPRVPIGVDRLVSRDYVPQRRASWSGQKRGQHLPPLITAAESYPPKIKMKERIFYHNSDDSDGRDGLTDRSGHSVTSWMSNQSAFERPPSDIYTPEVSPHGRRSQEFHFGNPVYAYREHQKPPRNAYPSPPPSPPLNYGDERYYNDRALDWRDSKNYSRGNNYRRAPEMARRNTYPPLVQGSGYDYSVAAPRSPRHSFDDVNRRTAEAVDHMMSKTRAERERGRRKDRERERDRDRYRRAEEERYGNRRYHGYRD